MSLAPLARALLTPSQQSRTPARLHLRSPVAASWSIRPGVVDLELSANQRRGAPAKAGAPFPCVESAPNRILLERRAGLRSGSRLRTAVASSQGTRSSPHYARRSDGRTRGP